MSANTEHLNGTPRKSRTLILCFDGTTDQYDDSNTNIVKLYSLFQKDNAEEQLCYYQPGVGTYIQPGIISPLFSWAAQTLDKAIAWYLYQHVMDGYRFLMQNYNFGDRVLLFGFSRGAYTARALAGMLYKVGLLSKDNFEQIPFAYKLYTSGNDTVAEGFKAAFGRPVPIQFVGVWDTVSSVGVIMAPNLPFVSVNTTIKVFRQALALDERRAKFRPNFYHQAKPKTTLESSNVKAQDIESGVQAPQGETDEQFTKTHVKEVWFVGCHADVGGGSVLDSNGHALSNISLRWMIKELLDADCGVLFNLSAFGRWNLDVNLVQPQLSTASQSQLTSQGLDQNRGLTNRAKGRENQSQASLSTYELEDLKDLQQKPIDQLEKKPISMWWFLEIIPTTFTFTNPLGETESKRDCHFGRGRWVPPNPLFHKSVEMHRERNGYKPRANYKENSETYVS